MKIVHGNLLSLASEFDVILHGCNCLHIMGAGIAYQIANKWPRVLEADMKTPVGPAKLGTISVSEGSPTIVNCYTQPAPGPCLSYEALADCLKTVATAFPGKKIGMPQIGAGLAGGDWAIIEKHIKAILDPVADVTVVIYAH